MNCQSLLSQLPEDWHEKLEMDFSSLLEQGFSMEQCLTDVTAMKQLYTSFTRAEKAALMTIISSIGTQPFRQTDFVDQVVNLDTRVSPAEQLVGLLYLRQKAVVFTIQTSWGEAKYLIPGDSFPYWHRIALQSHKTSALDRKAEIIAIPTHDCTSLLRNLLLMVVQLTKSKLSKTKNGSWHKREQDQLIDLCTIKRDWVGESPLNYVLQLAHHLNLISIHKDGVTLLKDNVEAWLHQPLQTIQRQLYIYFRDRSKNLQDRLWMHFIYWSEAQPDWFSVDEFIRWAQEHQLASMEACRQITNEGDDDWFVSLTHLGWMEAGQTAHGQRYYRYLLNKPAQGELFVKPDFEVLMSPTAPLAVRWLLEMFAERIQEDSLITYVLTKKSVKHALDYGLTEEDWLNQIQHYAKHGIPNNVRHTVQQWAQECTRFQLSEQVVLTCDSEQSAIEIERNQTLQPYIEKIGTRHFLVPQDKKSLFLQQFSRCGYLAQHAHQAPKNDLKQRSEPGNRRQQSHRLHLEVNYPALPEVYPGLREIPTMWLNELRSYHSSTAKAIIEKALQWRALIKCKMNDKAFLFMPEKVEQNLDRNWVVLGRGVDGQKQQWNGNKFAKLQLILPGVNKKSW